MSTAFKISSFLETNSRVHEFEYEVMDMRRVGEKDINLLSVLSEEEIRQLDSLKSKRIEYSGLLEGMQLNLRCLSTNYRGQY